MATNDAICNIAKLLVPISDKWYVLGYALGYSINQLDGLKTSHPNAPDSDCMSIVLRAAQACCVNTPTFVSALMTALQSPLVGAPHLASELAKGTAVLTVKMKMFNMYTRYLGFGVGESSAMATSSGSKYSTNKQ